MCNLHSIPSDSRIGSQFFSPTGDENDQGFLEALTGRDAEVQKHEADHYSAAGSFATGGPRFTYQKGPGGKYFAIGGEVGVDLSEIPGNPEASLQKAQQIKRSALAPHSPSSQDFNVAAQADRIEAKAHQEMSNKGKMGNGNFHVCQDCGTYSFNRNFAQGGSGASSL